MDAQAIHQTGNLGLERHPHARNLMHQAACDMFAVEDDVAFGRHQLTAEAFEEGRFTRTMGPNLVAKFIAFKFHGGPVACRAAAKRITTSWASSTVSCLMAHLPRS